MRTPGRVSFVVPTRDNARTIERCVRSAVEQPGDIEVVVVDNHSADDTARLAARAGAHLVLTAGPERSAQRNRGLERSTGEIAVFIDSDMVLDHAVADALRRCFADPNVAGVVLPEESFGVGYLAASRNLEKRLAMGDPAVEAARAFRAETLDRVGGYDETLHAFEDYELSDRVAAAGMRIERSPRGVFHDEGRVHLTDLVRKKRYYGTQWQVGRHRLAPHRLGRRRWSTAVLASDLVHAPGLLVLKLVDTAGLAAGAAQASLTNRR